METFLRPEEFDTDPNAPQADRQWLHWFRTFNNFLNSLSQLDPHKLDTVINYVANILQTVLLMKKLLKYFKDCILNQKMKCLLIISLLHVNKNLVKA